MLFKKNVYKVKLKGRSGVEYSEGKKKIFIGSEFMSGSNGIVIYSDSLKAWQPPYDNEKLSINKIEKIKHNITEDLKGHGIPVEWV
jgi:hypothetical protein